MVERFNGRIEDVLQSHRFQSGEALEQTLLRYAHLYTTASSRNPSCKGDPQSMLSRIGNVKGQTSSGRGPAITRDVTALS